MRPVFMFKRILVLTALAVALSGCSSIKNIFGKDKDDGKPTDPAELVDFTPAATVTKLWSASAGKGENRLGVRQGPEIADGRVYAAAVEGGVRAFDLQTGKLVWSHDSDLRLSGGPGVGDGLVVVGSLDGHVLALDAATGAEKWQAKVPNEVITAPAVGQGFVLVRSNDGRVSAFDANTGERRWFSNKDLPSLTVRGNAPVTLGPGIAFVNNDDGTLSAMALNDGRPMWTQIVGVPEGRTELDRMADADGPAILDGTTIFATSFKQETVAIDGPSGRPIWTRDNGGVGGLGLAPGSVVVSDRDGTVWALDKSTGAPVWSNVTLARRSLTAPTVQGDYVVVGDFDGYLHWLRLDNGELAMRERAGGKAVRAKPALADGILVVQNVDGELSAFRVQ
jgi:outer membrane protein assembly factor BamB